MRICRPSEKQTKLSGKHSGRTFLLFPLILLLFCSCTLRDKSASTQPERIPIPADLKAGDTLIFGRYEQDNDLKNGAEPIEWKILTVENGRALVISRYALDAVPYNKTYINVTWRSSTLRKWLNGDFFSAAFSPEESNRITKVKISNPSNVFSRARGGGPTNDRIFLLSFDDAGRYFPDDAARQCGASAYAKAKGAYVAEDGNSWWWLRSPGRDGQTAAIVLYGGYVSGIGYSVSDGSNVVRPAFWLDLS